MNGFLGKKEFIMLHIISDNFYFLSGFKGMYEKSEAFKGDLSFSFIGSNGFNADISGALDDLATNNNFIILNVMCIKIRSQLLKMIGKMKRKVLIVSKHIQDKKEVGSVVSILANPDISFDELIKNVSLVKDETVRVDLNVFEQSLLLLLGHGESIHSLSKSMVKSRKVVSSLKNRAIGKLGLSGVRVTNLLLCCDILRLINASNISTTDYTSAVEKVNSK